MLLEVVAPSEGSFKWHLSDTNVASRQKIGSILETPCFYPYLSAVQNLKVAAHIKKAGHRNIESVLKRVKLFDRKDDRFKGYSLGMKQRLSIASALLADPPVLILDEPTNGLDPEGIAEVRQLIAEIAQDGKTIIMASHLLDEVQKVCTDFCVLKNGKKLYEGSVHEILSETNRVEVSSTDAQKMKEVLEGFDAIESINEMNGKTMVHLKDGYNSGDLNRYCFAHDVTLRSLAPQINSLEAEFLKILKEND
jgi:ABC-2 type transport system ATP-binding protein